MPLKIQNLQKNGGSVAKSLLGQLVAIVFQKKIGSTVLCVGTKSLKIKLNKGKA